MSGTAQTGMQAGITAENSAELERLFNEHLNGPAAESVSVDQVKAKFKELWPTVKQGLDLLKQLAAVIPGVGTMVTVVIGVIIAAGDAAFKAISGG